MKSHRLISLALLVAGIIPIWAAATDAGTPAAAMGGDIYAADEEVRVPPPGKPELAAGGYLKLGFDRLGWYKFVEPPKPDLKVNPHAIQASADGQIPADIKGWNDRKAVITGFMLPLRMEKGLITEFFLEKSQQSCCYGALPVMNEHVLVRMKVGVPSEMDTPVSVYGILKVGSTYDRNYLTGIYEFVGEKVVKTPAAK